MKTLLASILAVGLLTGSASARTVFDDIRDTAPRSVFEDIRDTAPRSVFEDLNSTAPRSVFDGLTEAAPRSTGLPGEVEPLTP
ncbi:MAG TPA: hypothetical protein VFV47_03675 [Hyphomicrobiaceae bacterium]|nr:hypothetical protein [Hyphomicrobiaceae bacterium]